MKKEKEPTETTTKEYAHRLKRIQTARWKQVLDVQAPYRWNIRRLKPGYTLDVGCGIGRNLLHLQGNGIGIDHNSEAVELAIKQGLKAFTPEDFWQSAHAVPNRYDTILLAHVAEHMTKNNTVALIKQYIPLLKPSGKLILITPQEAGFRSDASHVEFMDFPKLRTISGDLGLFFFTEYSFPFPRLIGRFFKFNEFISVSYKSKDSRHDSNL